MSRDTLAQFFIKDKEGRKFFRTRNEGSHDINNYILNASQMRSELKCGSGNNCHWFSASESDRKKDELQKFAVCITCDQIYHLKCTGVDLSTLREKDLPWMCNYCIGNPCNAAAQQLMQDKRDTKSFIERINFFKKAETPQLSTQIEMESEPVEIDDEEDEEVKSFDESLRLVLEDTSSQDDVTDKFNMLRLKFVEQVKEKKRLQKSLESSFSAEHPAVGQQASTSTQQFGIGQQQRSSIGHSGSYADAVLDANRSSTDNHAASSDDSLRNIFLNMPITQRASISHETLEDKTMRHIELLTLSEIRKNLPKIVVFDGKPEKWLTFQRDIERNREEGKYPEQLMKSQLRMALAGQALTRVEGLFATHTVDQIMFYLREAYGNSNLMVETSRAKLLSVKLAKPLTHASCVETTTYITSYIAACTYAGIAFNDTALSSKIHSQLESHHQEAYYKFYFEKFPQATTRMESLDVQFEFLNSISKTLPLGNFSKNDVNKGQREKSNQYQLMYASSPTTSPSNYPMKNKSSFPNDSYKYEIRDKNTAKYLGYDMDKVNAMIRKCEFCRRNNHHSVECTNYRSANLEAKHNMARSKNLCTNCLISTDHRSGDCDMKPGCGYKIDNNARCSAKHHISLHQRNNNRSRNYGGYYRKQNRRRHSNENATRADERVRQHQTQQAEPPAQVMVQQGHSHSVAQGYPVQVPVAASAANQPRPYTIDRSFNSNAISQLYSVGEGSQRTIKMFRTLFYGNQVRAMGYAIGDSAAEVTLVKKELIEDLGISGDPCVIKIQWTDGTIKSIEAIRVKLKISGNVKKAEIVELEECYAISDFNLPPRSLDVEKLKSQFPHLKPVPFDSYIDAVPTLLIGSRHASLIEAVEPVIQGGSNMPIAMKSRIGYTIYGGAPESFPDEPTVVNTTQAKNLMGSEDREELDRELTRIYVHSCLIDSLGIKNVETHLTKDEKQAIKLIKDEMRILPNGSVEVPLIWKLTDGQIPRLPNNFPAVYHRQVAQEKKLSKEPTSLKAYNENFMELVNKKYVRPATERDMSTTWRNVWYLPMSLHVNQNKQPIKYRNVYDASARYKGTSLNENLLMGPNLLVNILAPLMRMRMYKYAFTADVKSMFHQVMISEEDQQCQRVMWRYDHSQPLQVYIQQVMLFGPKCSPFASQIVKNETADRWSQKYPNATKALKEYTYMDDLLYSEPTLESAVEIASQCIEILKSINWDLVNFQSNSTKLLQEISQNNVKRETIEIMSSTEATYTTKVLGVAWNPKIDAFEFHLNKNAFIKLAKDCGLKPTKRDQCSTIARIFDVLGLISHCIIRGKILLQRSWRKKLEWDDEISNEDHREWLKWLSDLEKVSLLKIPRLRFQNFNLLDAQSLEIHTFCDAGKEAIAAVSYMVGTFNNYRSTSLIMSKAKVAPLKAKTKTEISEMPRLELLSCLIAARLTRTVVDLHKELQLKVFLWSDSEIVLNWLRNDSLKLPKFAISPVEEILEISNVEQWRHVDSKNNAADLATKFQKFNFADVNSMWYQGPNFLRLSDDHWPKQKLKEVGQEEFLVNSVITEELQLNSELKLPHLDCPFAKDSIIDAFSPQIASRWSKLTRAVGRALKFYNQAIVPLAKSRKWFTMATWQAIKTNNTNFVDLTDEEIETAELFIIRRIQREVYPIEYERLKKNKRISNPELLQLNVFLDRNGLIRINSRVNEPKENYAQKFAPLLPRKSQLAVTLLFDYHYKHNHVGIETQVADLRSRFWMPQARAALRKVQSMCNYCGFRRANPVEYKMSALPNVRTSTNLRPFEVTGLDCAGPFIVYARNGHQKKVWILIFTCTMSRFVCLHVLDDLSSLSVFEAIMVLWTNHGPVKQFISDNGTNFVGAANVIHQEKQKLIQFLKDSNKEIESKLAQEKFVRWTFIPVQSPWFGGFYERLIQTVKKSIETSIEGKKVTKTEFNIALQEASHRINCRPLSHNPISSEDEEVLTPHHLVKLRSGWPLLPSVHGIKNIPDPKKDKDQYRRGRIIADEMLRKFVAYYLPVLTKRTKWFKDFSPIKEGDLVLLIDPNLTRKAWERARVEKVYMSKDGNVRVVDLLMPDGTIRKNRSAKRLAKIEIKTM